VRRFQVLCPALRCYFGVALLGLYWASRALLGEVARLIRPNELAGTVMSFGQNAGAACCHMHIAATACPRHILADVNTSYVRPFVGAHGLPEELGPAVFVTVHAS
jgi:hypothetical protein